MRRFTLIFALLVSVAMMAEDSIPVQADDTLATLTRVSSAEEMINGHQYIFCRNGRVLIPSSSSPTPTTDKWLADSLTGNEEYVWTLESFGSKEGFYILSVQGWFLNNTNNNELKCSLGGISLWFFEFAEDSTAIICTNTDNSKRFIGEKTAYSGQYIAPANMQRPYYPHDFIIYRLDFPEPEIPEEPDEPEEPEVTALTVPSLTGEQGRILWHEGHLLILRDGRTYTLTGQPVR